MGIEAHGAIKGCPSLQPAYVGGNVRDRSIAAIWSSDLSVKRELWGFCQTCPFAATCRGGCSFTAHSVFGRAGNNPYCHYRARAMAKQGLRERLVPATPAPGAPFDHGTFELVVEPAEAPEPATVPLVPLRSVVRAGDRRRRSPP